MECANADGLFGMTDVVELREMIMSHIVGVALWNRAKEEDDPWDDVPMHSEVPSPIDPQHSP